MIDVKYHTCLRYVERVMGMEGIDELSNVQANAIRVKIIKAIEPYLGAIQTVKNGKFIIDDVIYIVTNLSVVTITTPGLEGDANIKRIKGGIMRSGKKLKKIKHISFYDREEKRNGNTD